MPTKRQLIEYLEAIDDDEEFMLVAGDDIEEGDVLELTEILNLSNGLTRQVIVAQVD